MQVKKGRLDRVGGGDQTFPSIPACFALASLPFSFACVNKYLIEVVNSLHRSRSYKFSFWFSLFPKVNPLSLKKQLLTFDIKISLRDNSADTYGHSSESDGKTRTGWRGMECGWQIAMIKWGKWIAHDKIRFTKYGWKNAVGKLQMTICGW